MSTTEPVDTGLVRKLDGRQVIARHRKIRVVPVGLTEEEMRALYAGICRVVMELCRGRDATAFISCNEAHNILKQSSFSTASERMITGDGSIASSACISVSDPDRSIRR